MSLRKHGVGEILPDPNEDHTKQASQQQPWSNQDEQDLANESEE